MFQPSKPSKPRKTQTPYAGNPEYIEVTIHKFKSNIAYYMRLCESGAVKGIVLKRYGRRAGLNMPMPDKREVSP